jgi:hypothetical protein
MKLLVPLTGKGNLQAITKRKGVLMVAVNLLHLKGSNMVTPY